jgi:hypothetical protein
LSPRTAGAAAVIAGLLAGAGDAYHLFVLDERSEQLATTGYRLHGFALMAALVLFVVAAPALAATRGRLARAALVITVAGTALVVGDIWAEVVVVPGVVGPQPELADIDISGFHLAAVIGAYALFALGWLLYGVAALRDHWSSAPVAWLVMVGAVLGFLPIGGSYIVLSVGLALLGGTLLTDAKTTVSGQVTAHGAGQAR